MSKKITYKDYKEKAEILGYIILSDENEFIDRKSKLKLLCTICNNEVEKSYSDFQYGCPKCRYIKMSQNMKLDLETDVLPEFQKRGLVCLETKYIDNQTPMRFICSNHKDKGVQSVKLNDMKSRNEGCKYCGYERVSEKLKGECSHLYKGGITPLTHFLRNTIQQWKADSMRNCNYKCTFTGQSFDDIHHLYGFNLIVQESMDELNLSIYQDMVLYSEQERNLIQLTVLKNHYKYPFGVCLCEPLHFLFHKEYSKGNNTPEQFKEFIIRLKQGEFSDFLEENNLEFNINYDVLNQLLGGESVCHKQEVS